MANHMLAIAWAGVSISGVLFLIALRELVHGKLERNLHMEWITSKYPSTLTDAQIKHFNSIRWDLND